MYDSKEFLNMVLNYIAITCTRYLIGCMEFFLLQDPHFENSLFQPFGPLSSLSLQGPPHSKFEGLFFEILHTYKRTNIF